MKKAYISPVTSFLLSLSLVVGIFVSGLTNSRLLPAAKAQTITGEAPPATVVGTVIYLRGVVINGVVTDAVIPGSVRISNSVVDSTSGVVSRNGVFTSGNDEEITPSQNGVYTSGNDEDGNVVTANGVYTSGNDGEEEPQASGDGVFTSGNVYLGDCLQIVGGVLSGNDIQINDGVISGSDLQVTAGYVTGACGN